MSYEEKLIPVSSLLLDPHNARHGELSNAREILNWMISAKPRRDKLFELAADIAEYGMNPLTKLAVMPVRKRGKADLQYTVLEGNRRVTALNFLADPELVLDGRIKKKFQKLASDAKVSIPVECACVVFPKRDDPDHWIDLIHQRGLGGASTNQWGPLVTARRAMQSGKFTNHSAAVLMIDDAIARDMVEEEALQDVPLTNFTRVLNTGSLSKITGLKVDGGTLKTTLTAEAYDSLVRRLLRDLAGIGGKKTHESRRLDKVEDRNDYVQTLNRELGLSESQADGKRKVRDVDEKPKKKATRKAKPARGKKVIPYRTPGDLESPLGQQVVSELRKLDCYAFPFAAAACLRALLEFGVAEYLERPKGKSMPKNLTRDDVLATKVEKFIDSALGGDKSDKSGKKSQLITSFKIRLKEKHGPLSIHRLHNFLHNRQYTADGKDLQRYWDDLREMWEALLNQETP